MSKPKLEERTLEEKAPGAEEEAPLPSRPLPKLALQRAEFVRNVYRVMLPSMTRYEDLLGDDCSRILTPVEDMLLRGDLIEVIDDAGSLFATLLVHETKPAKLVELLNVPLAGEPIDDMKGTGEWRIGWGGWTRRWCVIRPNSGVAREGIRTREEAAADVHGRNAPAQHRHTLG